MKTGQGGIRANLIHQQDNGGETQFAAVAAVAFATGLYTTQGFFIAIA
jgi:hypothetical protein